MDIQKSLLQMLKHKEHFDKLHSMIRYDELDTDTADMLRDFVKFFKKNPDIETITSELYIGMKQMADEYDSDDERDLDEVLFKEIEKEPNDDVAKSITRNIIRLKYTAQIEKVLARFKIGNEDAPYEAVREVQEHFKRTLGTGRQKGPVEETLEEIFEDHDTGLTFKWKLSPLNESMANVRTGREIIIAARPDTGKTSFIADQVTYMAAQTKGQTNRPILWLNNEGKGSEIKVTAFRAALNLTYDELRALPKGKAQQAFDEYIGGANRLRIYDVHGMHYTEIEDIIEEENPCIVVADMLDNVKGFEGEARTDLRLEQLYIWFREASVIYDFLALPTSQVSSAGEGEAFPPKSMLKDSQTGKQGACDGIIMIGMKNDASLVNTRYISCPKNKFKQVDGAKKLCLADVYFDFERARYHNPVGHKDNPKKGAVEYG